MAPGRPGVRREEQQNLEKQMGCITGFFQLFDRQQIMTRRRIYSTRRLPSSPATSSPSPSESSDGIAKQPFSKDSPEKLNVQRENRTTLTSTPSRPSVTLPLPVSEFKEGSKSPWKLRDAPRLSLDSRRHDQNSNKLYPPEIRTRLAVTSSDSAEDQRRSPGVVARLMGLDLLPKSEVAGGVSPNVAAVSHRKLPPSESASMTEYLQFPNFLQERKSSQKPKPPPATTTSLQKKKSSHRKLPPSESASMTEYLQFPNYLQERKSSFNGQDIFPEPSKKAIERKQKKDLEELKQILEGLHLKGLLHSNPSPQCSQSTGRNLILDDQQRLRRQPSPIVLMKKTSGLNPSQPRRKNNYDSRSNPASEPRARRGRINGRILPNPTCPVSPTRGKSTSTNRLHSSEITPTRSKQTVRRSTPMKPSEKINRLTKQPPSTTPDRFSDASSTISDSNSVCSSHVDFKNVKMEYLEGRNLLLLHRRCDKLLHSIAEITSSPQPSPVSVLHSAASFRSDGAGDVNGDVGDLGSPSSSDPTRRNVFKDEVREDRSQEEEEEEKESCKPPSSSDQLISSDDAEAVEKDFVYVAEIFRSSATGLSTDLFLSLEHKYEKEEGNSDTSRLHRRLTFDTVVDIFNSNRQLSPWDTFRRSLSITTNCDTWRSSTQSLARETWVELRRIREPIAADDMYELTRGLLRKDLVGGGGVRDWSDRTVEMSDTVLDIERLIFKDLVAETVGELATVFSYCRKNRAGKTKAKVTAVSRRKHLFF